MCDQCISTVAASAGSRRRRLWDLPHQCHCPLVGVCFPLSTLRHLVNKALGGQAMADDYEVHVGAVSECLQRNRLSELLQKDLESRYASTVQAFRVAKTSKDLAELWADAVRRGDVAGAFWAALTHPRCDEVLHRPGHLPDRLHQPQRLLAGQGFLQAKRQAMRFCRKSQHLVAVTLTAANRAGSMIGGQHRLHQTTFVSYPATRTR